MTTPKFTLFVVVLFFGEMAIHLKQASALHQDSGLKSANIGDNVTLRCFYGNGTGSNWYKQTLGQKPQLVSTFYKYNQDSILHDEFKDNPRFSLNTAVKGTHHLQISNLHPTYYCMSIRSYVDTKFPDGAILSVKGSQSNVRAIIHQPVSESVELGASVTLNCTVHTETCDGEHSVYWFRSSTESQPGVIYTHSETEFCKKTPKSGQSTQSCVYELTKRNVTVADDGAYICGVTLCGEMFFGNGTTLDIKRNQVHEDHVNTTVTALVVSNVLLGMSTLLLAWALCKSWSKDHKGNTDISSSQPQNGDDVSYAAVTFTSRGPSSSRMDRVKSNRDTATYSDVRFLQQE